MSLGSTLAVERPPIKWKSLQRAQQRARQRELHPELIRKRIKLPLSPRQQQFVEGLIAGHTVGEIGTQYGCTDGYIYARLRAAQLRSGCRTREQLVVWWDRRTRATLMTNDTAQSAIPDNRGSEPHTPPDRC